MKQEIPDWCFRGGSFRAGFSTEDVPASWIFKGDRWQRSDLVPFGKASLEYRERFYICSVCSGKLLPSAAAYEFVCSECSEIYKWGWGGLRQKEEHSHFDSILD